jgi:hypothetical protein
MPTNYLVSATPPQKVEIPWPTTPPPPPQCKFNAIAPSECVRVNISTRITPEDRRAHDDVPDLDVEATQLLYKK